MKKAIKVLWVLLVVLAMSAGALTVQGHAATAKPSYEEGFEEGRAAGYRIGWLDAENGAEYNTGFEGDCDKGLGKKYSEGYHDGCKVGYSEGWNAFFEYQAAQEQEAAPGSWLSRAADYIRGLFQLSFNWDNSFNFSVTGRHGISIGNGLNFSLY
ncbi:MAG: hypothetical protein LBB75_03835 [Oscillospiraceae bacterium]|jgi:hypothetical protein|nr:hypothetical protein [Oscillospiraceae bacterium]